MEKNVPIIIEKIGNGWMVRQHIIAQNVATVPLSDVYCFQNFQYTNDENGSTKERTLVGWLESHFDGEK